ncbi:MAG TPA: DegT/DnrJ/EryC1/StrS family aminotransferase [Stellaceae bacterium]|nr:DegT/DnrJ/EryC1/StrS family aminotransferase [Stellaceae bacterium]
MPSNAGERSPILQTDPKAGYLAARAAIDAAIRRVLEGGTYILGAEVEAFERAFAAFIGAAHAVGTASGTDALVLALRALDLAPDDYVVTVAHTAIATVAAIELAGARPLLVDIDPATMTLDAGALADALAAPPGRVAAVVPVHLYGQAADLDAILALARRHGLRVVEDCAQSHGALLHGRRLGSFGDVAAFSFYPTKNLGAFGDAGMVVTDNAALAGRVAALRQYGWGEHRISATVGMNSRLDALQAAILGVKLDRLDDDNARRAAIAAIYDAGLAAAGLVLPARRPDAAHVFHQYVVRHGRRDALRAALGRRLVGTGIHYPVPVHRQPAYRDRLALGPVGLGASERAAAEVLSLPIYPQLGAAAAHRVVAAVKDALPEIG